MAWILLYYTLELFKWLIVARAVVSWFASPYSDNPLVSALRRITDPILRPLASIIPPLGAVDVTPLVAFFAIIVVQGLIRGLV